MLPTEKHSDPTEVRQAYETLCRNLGGSELEAVELLWRGFDRLQRERLPLLEENRQLRTSVEVGSSRGIVLAGKHHCYVSGEELASILEVSSTTIKRWDKAGLMPPPVRVPKDSGDGRGPGRGFVRWDLADVVNFLEKYKRY